MNTLPHLPDLQLSFSVTVVKFCFVLRKNAAEIILILKTAYKDDALGKTQVYELFSCFKNGEMTIYDKLHPGRPSMSRTDKIFLKCKKTDAKPLTNWTYCPESLGFRF